MIHAMKIQCIMLCAAFAALNVSAKTSTPEGWLDDYDAALRKAAAENKHIVIDFSGSDWCGWCMRLDKEVFSTDAFRKGAADKYVLLMVDSPSDKSLLTPEAAKRNPELVKKFGVEGFPVVVVLDPKGEEVCRLGYESGGPEKYLERLDAEIRDAPDVKKYIKPIEAVLNRYDKEIADESRKVARKVQDGVPMPAKNADNEELDKFYSEIRKRAQKILLVEVYPKYVPLIEKALAEAKAMKVPENMEARKKYLIEGQEENFNVLKDAIRRHGKSKKSGNPGAEEPAGDDDDDDDDDDGDVTSSGRGSDAWLKDWCENVRTNTEIETCASFRDNRLKPFLMAQMDPEGKATPDERKVMEKSIDYIWGSGGYKSFGERKRLVEILGRTAKKPFAAMVKTLVDNRNITDPMAEWLVDGKFTGEDMRCTFWTLRNNGAFDRPRSKNLADRLEKESADEWLQLIFRIDAERDAAWASRGGGYANTVTEEGWRGYGDHGEACRAAFRRAWELHKYPEAVYLFSALGPFDDEVFVDATAVQLDFDGLFGNYLWYNCYPRWCGSLAKMKAFAERCYETKRHDTMVPYMYAEAMLRMAKDAGVRQEDYFREHAAELDRVLEVSLPVIKNADAFGNMRQEAGVFATLAYSIMGDWEKAGETFRSFWHGTLPKKTWSVVQDLSHWWLIWDGISGTNRKEMQRLHALFAAGDFAGFVRGSEELRSRGVKLDGTESTYLMQMGLAARMKTDFTEGKPIVAAFPKDKMSWLTYNGHCRMNGEYAFPGGGVYKPSSTLEWDVVAPGEFRIEFEIGPDGSRDEWRFDFCEKPADPALADGGDYPFVMLRFGKSGATAMFGKWNEVKDGGSGMSVEFGYEGGNVRVAVEYRDGTASVFVSDFEKPVLASDAHARYLKRVAEGKFRFNGAGVRLLSMKVMRPGAAKE